MQVVAAAEVAQDGAAVVGQQHVLRLEVAVHDAMLVQESRGGKHVAQHAGHLRVQLGLPAMLLHPGPAGDGTVSARRVKQDNG